MRIALGTAGVPTIVPTRRRRARLSLFDDPLLGNSALARLANASYQMVIAGTSYWERLYPHPALLGPKGDD